MALQLTTTDDQGLLLKAPRDFKGATSVTPGTATAIGISISATTLTRSGTTATFTATAAHRLVSGQKVTIAGADKAQFNGVFNIAVTGATTFTYVITSDPGANASGTITATYTPMAQWAFIEADAANTAPITFGANAQADFHPIAAGDGFTLPVPTGAKLDLTAFWVKSTAASQNWRILFF